jgi:hypothetical protein
MQPRLRGRVGALAVTTCIVTPITASLMVQRQAGGHLLFRVAVASDC